MFALEHMGALFKKIRLARHLSLEDVSGDYLSVSFLSKFERGKSDISLSRFIQLLDNMDVGIDEFYSILSAEHGTASEELIKKAGNAYQSNNLSALKKLYREEAEKYQASGKKKFLYNQIMVESFLCHFTGEEVSRDHIKEMTDYLFAIEHWGKRELIIFGNSMPAISSETLDLLTNEMLYRNQLLGQTGEDLKERLGLVLNAISVFLDRNELARAEKYIFQVKSIGIPEVSLYQRLLFQFLIGVYWVKIGEVEKGQKKMEQMMECVERLGCENLLLSLEEQGKDIFHP